MFACTRIFLPINGRREIARHAPGPVLMVPAAGAGDLPGTPGDSDDGPI